MTQFDYDLFVIGAGSGGIRAARLAAGFGARVAIAEQRYLGGTCVNVGCIPKKLLVYAAHFGEDFEDAQGYGWTAEGIGFDWQRLIANKNTEIERLHGVYSKLLEQAGISVLNGRASLVDPHTVRIGDEPYTAERILIATGGWPLVPDIPGKEHGITSNESFFLADLPKRVIILGGGYIAVEFAGIFNGLGAQTTVLYHGPLFLRGFDDDVREFLAQELRKKGVELKFNTHVKAIEKNRGGVSVVLMDDSEKLEADLILYAIGRVPQVGGLGLEAIGVRLTDKGAIGVDADHRSSVPSLYAIGDVIDRVKLTPMALAEARAFALTQFGGLPERLDYNLIPTAIFSHPNVGTVGLTEAAARKHFDAIAIYKSHFTPLKHTLTGRGEKTLMKLVVDRATDRVLGAHMVGPEAGEIIQGIAIALKAKATKAIFDSTLGIHPTAAEEFVTMRAPERE
jgi:glutathione reductase (NADPH)